MGRSSEYTPELGAAICERIAAGESLVKICSDEPMPHRATVHEWLVRFKDFGDTYARAREDQADHFADEMVAIADDTSGDPNRDRLRLDTRKWVAAKLKPKKYGERIDHKVEGEIKHYVVEVPAQAGDTDLWLSKLSSGVPSADPK